MLTAHGGPGASRRQLPCRCRTTSSPSPSTSRSCRTQSSNAAPSRHRIGRRPIRAMVASVAATCCWTRRRDALRGTREVELSPREFASARVPGTQRPRRADPIADRRRGLGTATYTEGSNLVDVYVGYLRRMLESGGEHRLIRTVRGHGFQLVAGGDRSMTCGRRLTRAARRVSSRSARCCSGSSPVVSVEQVLLLGVDASCAGRRSAGRRGRSHRPTRRRATLVGGGRGPATGPGRAPTSSSVAARYRPGRRPPTVGCCCATARSMRSVACRSRRWIDDVGDLLAADRPHRWGNDSASRRPSARRERGPGPRDRSPSCPASWARCCGCSWSPA